MKLTVEQATEQLRVLIGSLVDLPEDWDPLNKTQDDYSVLEWIVDPSNTWCSGKKHDFKILTEGAYSPGQYAWVVLTILGIQVKGRE